MSPKNLKGAGILIPAYNPDQKLKDIVRDHIDQGFSRIVIVNDGSDIEASQIIFAEIAQNPEVLVLTHSHNLGKGEALKTGFKFYLEEAATSTVVTVDADGQHLAQDVKLVADTGLDHPDSLVLGVRNFGEDVPLRSKLGNQTTRVILGVTKGLWLKDTQTGLRSYPAKFLQKLIEIQSSRYEYEFETLLVFREQGVDIIERTITTVYIDNNIESHFRPLIDSCRIYFVFLRYLFVSLASFVLDIVIFFIAMQFTNSILYSTYFARSISATFNFAMNKYKVFRVTGLQSLSREIAGYSLLALVIATISGASVSLVYKAVDSNLLWVKIIVDILLFFLTCYVQRRFIFSRSEMN